MNSQCIVALKLSSALQHLRKLSYILGHFTLNWSHHAKSLLFSSSSLVSLLFCPTVSPSRISHLPRRRMKTYRSRVPAARRISRYPGYIGRPSYSLTKQARFCAHTNARLEAALPFVIVRYRVRVSKIRDKTCSRSSSFMRVVIRDR